MTSKTEELMLRLSRALPEPDEDGIYGDGSHEHYADMYRDAYDTAEAVASSALRMLDDMMSDDNGTDTEGVQ